MAKEHISDFERANVGSHKYMKVRQYKEYAEAKSIVENQVQEKETQVAKKSLESDVVDQYKELETVKQQVESESEKLQLIGQCYVELEKRVKQQQQELDSVADQVPNKPIKIPFLRKEVVTEVHDKVFGKAEIKKKQTRNYVLSPEQYQKLTKQVNAAVTVKKDYEYLRKTNFVREYQSLKMTAEDWMTENRTLKQEKGQLQKEVSVLHKEMGALKAHIKDLQTNIMVLYQQTKKSLKEQFQTLKELVKNELVGKGVNNHFEQKHKREINRQRGFDMER